MLNNSLPKPLSGGSPKIWKTFLPLIPKKEPSLHIPFASKEEEWVYLQLTEERKAGSIEGFEYQVPILGGRSKRGGRVLDFVVYNNYKTVLQINGDYWHTGYMADEEALFTEIIKRIFRVVVIFWNADMPNKEICQKNVHHWMVDRRGESKYA